MEDALPIIITASQNLLARFSKLKSVVNKQEAHLNFQSLAAGWYENESNVANIEIYLVCNEEYQKQLLIDNLGEKSEVADDVVLYISDKNMMCFVAITEAEVDLLEKEPKVLSSYITIKMKKVINEIAAKKGLIQLPV